MDEANLDALNAMKPDDYERASFGLLLDFAPQLERARDPGSVLSAAPEGFERVLDLVEPAMTGLVAEVQATISRR